MNHPCPCGNARFAVRGRTYPSEPAPQGVSPRPSVPRAPGSSGMRARHAIAVLALAFLAVTAWQFAGALWIHAKARLAQHLIAVSWEKAKAGGQARPWPWADTRPVARLAVPARGISLIVLAGTSGRTLAFGPGHADGTAPPGSAGNSVILAHRDTHFAFLRDLREDEEITVEDARGRTSRYRVRETAVVDKRAARLLDPADSAQLTLITCWPFDAVRPGSAQRYVVIADRT